MEAPVIFSLNHQQDLMITVHPERVPGWNVTVLTDKVKMYVCIVCLFVSFLWHEHCRLYSCGLTKVS